MNALELVKSQWEKHKMHKDYEVPWAECNITEYEIHGEKTTHCSICNRFKKIIKKLEEEMEVKKQ